MLILLLIIILLIIIAYRFILKTRPKQKTGGNERRCILISCPNQTIVKEVVSKCKSASMPCILRDVMSTRYGNKTNKLVVGTSLRDDDILLTGEKYHIHVCPVPLKHDIAEINLAKATLLPHLPNGDWDKYWDNLCHSSINCFVSDPTSAVKIAKEIKSQ